MILNTHSILKTSRFFFFLLLPGQYRPMPFHLFMQLKLSSSPPSLHKVMLKALQTFFSNLAICCLCFRCRRSGSWISGLSFLLPLLGFCSGNEHFSMPSPTNCLQFKELPGLSPSPYLYLFYLRAFCWECQTSPCFPKDISHYYPSMQFSFTFIFSPIPSLNHRENIS